MEVLGHIKIGELRNGLPTQVNKIKVVQTYKNENNLFSEYKFSEEDLTDRLEVKLPFIDNVEDNFKIAEISFVTVNEIYKYRAEIISNHVYLIPYQPNFEKVLEDLPVIKLGTVKKWKESLQMELRAIGYFIVTEKNNNLFYFSERNSFVVDFKTMSAFSIIEMKKRIESLKELPKDILSNLNLKLVYKRKLFKTNKFSEVKYLTIADILPEDIISASKNEVSKRTIDSICRIEQFSKKLYKDSIKNAINLEEANEFFGKQLMIKVDNEALNEFGSVTTSEDLIERVEKINEKKEEVEAKQEEIKASLEENEDIVLKLIENNIPKKVAKAFVVKHGKLAFKMAKDLEFDIQGLIKNL